MRRLVTLAGAAILTVFAGPAYATTPSTTPDCAEHGHDAEHNPHCDESTTTTTGEATTTTTSLLDLPTNPTTTTSLFVAPTTTTTFEPTIAPPHLDLPAVLPTTTTTVPAGVAGHHETKRLPATGAPAALLAAVGVLCLLCGGGVLRARRPPG